MNAKHSELLAVARQQAPADLLLRGGRIVNVFSGEIELADIAIANGRIAGIGPGYRANETIDLNGAFVAPGLIDAHVHIESSLCTPPEFAKAVVPRGVTTVVTDPHEIANVAGAAGIELMIELSRGLPLNVIVNAPSCVPATHMATGGASLGAADLAQLRATQAAHGLAEVMNFPGVINGDAEMLARIAAFRGRPIDGHAPGVRGAALNAYVAAGVGSDHECVTVEEAREKLARGLYVLIREASNARNLAALLPLINSRNSRRICLCTDDRQPADLLSGGGIDYALRQIIAAGVDPVEAFRMVTLNPSEWFCLHDRGAISPGRFADLMVFDELSNPVARMVFSSGRLVARDCRLLPDTMNLPAGRRAAAASADGAGHIAACSIHWDAVDLRIAAKSERVRVIGAVPDQLVTLPLVCVLPVRDGAVVADLTQDVLKMAVIERHRGTGNVGLGFIKGFGLQRGAIAGTVAHDHHNLVVIGADDESMMTAARAATATGGGLAVAVGGNVVATLALPVAGLMSEAPIEEVRDQYAGCIAAARGLGSTLADPMMAMSFMALEVIPSLKLTDRGLVDVERFQIIDLFP
ncbi:MAG TPA: adenine deaminase [Tepidisphaeraceae bacterium]|nr:adenine deaminase [Tepidisphaeraceae bacterium]